MIDVIEFYKKFENIKLLLKKKKCLIKKNKKKNEIKYL